MKADRKLILENGLEVCGTGFGAPGDRLCELVFDTSMAGYQEILSDPSYTGQAVVLTYPLIGNYGMAAEDYESRLAGPLVLIVREYNDEPSNFRCAETLSAVMERCGVAGLAGADTRLLTRTIREIGSCRALLTAVGVPKAEGLERLRSARLPHDAVARVSCKRPWSAGPESGAFHVAVLDCGVKLNIVRSLARRGCRVTVLPWDTGAAQILALRPDGVLISNGPGDPEDVPATIETVRGLLGRLPVFGICLGHQILALACGAKTYKLKFGHRGGNHPVRDLETGKIAFTSQNHSYAVDEASLAGTVLSVTHRNLLDQTVEGAACLRLRAFGVQYHPESAPGPQDSAYLFDRFLELMKEGRHAETH